MAIIETLWKILESVPLFEVFRDRGQRRHAHDREKMLELERLLPETAVDQYLEEMSQHRLSRGTLVQAATYMSWQRRETNQFLIRRLRRKHQAFGSALEALKNFSAEHFFPAQVADLFVLRPLQNPDFTSTDASGEALFQRTRLRLDELVLEADMAYKGFRRAAKHHLQI